jgi:kynurenine formamidase
VTHEPGAGVRCAPLAALAAALSLALACAGAGPAPTRERLVDLTWAFDADTIYWPTEEGFVHELGKAGVTDAGYYYEAHRFRAAEHGGPHIDAPIHFYAGRWTVDEIPLDRLIGDAVVVGVEAACARDRDHAIDVADLAAFEQAHGEIPRGAIVLLRSGFGRFWPDRRAYLGTQKHGPEAVAELHFPGLSPEAARWLIDERAIAAVGLDTPSIDPGVSTTFDTHRLLFEANVPAFENLANLEQLPPTGLRLIALPMKIGRGSGAPLRAVAIVPAAGGDAQ